MKAPKQETISIKPIDEGTINSVCCGIIDLGTQKTEWQGEIKYLPKIMFVFEVDEKYEKDGAIYNRCSYKEFTFSLGDKATLRKFLEGWVGKKTNEEWYEFDFDELIGKPCLLNIVHSTTKSGNTYANVASAAKLMKGMQPLEQIGTSMKFDFECADKDELDSKIEKLPRFIGDKIRQSKQYLAFTSPAGKHEMIPIQDDKLPF